MDVSDYDGKIIKITGAVGKTSMLISFSTNSFPEEYVPTVFDNYDTTHTVDNVRYSVSLVDTAGQEDYDEIRQMSYEDVDVILCCFAVDNPTSLNNISSNCKKNPIIMVGTKCDIEKKVSDKKIQQVKEGTNCVAYVLCSAKTSYGLNKVFDTAIRAYLQFVGGKKKRGGGGGLTDDGKTKCNCTIL